jgi:DnaJ-class molecular chaperone
MASNFNERKAFRRQHYYRFVYGWRLRPCSACNGSGRYDSWRNPRCGACDGTGKEWFRGPKAKEPEG